MERTEEEETKHLTAIREEMLTKFIPQLTSVVDELSKKSKRLKTLRSVVLGLYEELDKLCKKAPAEPLTSLALLQVNDVIEEAKVLGPDDAHLQKLKAFVAAGDNPEQRDAVMVLRLLQQGLDRTAGDLEGKLKTAERQFGDAQAIKVATGLRIQGARASKDDLEYNGVSPSGYWRTGSDYAYFFDFGRLDSTNLADHFSAIK